MAEDRKIEGLFCPLSRIPSEWSHQKPVCATPACSWKPAVKSEKPVHLYGPTTPATTAVHGLRPHVSDAGELGFPQGPRPGCRRVRFPPFVGEASTSSPSVTPRFTGFQPHIGLQDPTPCSPWLAFLKVRPT